VLWKGPAVGATWWPRVKNDFSCFRFAASFAAEGPVELFPPMRQAFADDFSQII
jgi:hypothetical protein